MEWQPDWKQAGTAAKARMRMAARFQ